MNYSFAFRAFFWGWSLFFFGNIQIASGQMGCTDPQASNYDASATQNDGSCLYPSTTYQPETIGLFEADLEENSGLAFFNGTLWTHNDGGGEDKLYQIDTATLEILKEVIIATADNEDWEDLAESNTHVFIGDFGNNNGNRTNLKIHKVSKNSLANNTVVNSEIIEFSYADQTDFSIANNNNDYDCEAFFYLNGNLHLFTKNWTDFQTRHYVIPDTPGTYDVSPENTFSCNGLITSAAIDITGTISLLGYTTAGTNFMWLLFDYPADDIFGGNKRRISLGNSLQNSQIEGIAFSSTGRGFIGAEKFSLLPAKLLSFESKEWTNNEVVNLQNPRSEVDIQIFPNPVGRGKQLSWSASIPVNKFEIYNANQQLIKTLNVRSLENTLSLASFATGCYFIKFYSSDSVLTKRLMIFD